MEHKVEYYPLTYPQKGIWYTEKMYPGTSIGNIAATLRLKGNIDYSLLERAINLFIEKNDAARLRVIEVNGEPKQYISEYTYHKINLYDFQEKELADLFHWEEEQAKKPFNLTDSELMHFDLIKVNDNDGGFFAKMHHLVSDAWTTSLLGNQVIEYYTALKNGDEIPDGNNPSYIDSIKTEEEYLKSERFCKDKEYWDKKFEIYPEKAILKKFEPNEISTRARRKAMVTPNKLSAKIHQYCAENKVSVYSLLIAALAMYINRITAKEDIIFGTTTLNRANAKEKEVVGLFINIAPISLNISADMNFKTLVEIVSRDGLSLLRHQKYPYDLVLREVRSKHKIKGNIFDIVLTYQNSRFAKEKHAEEYATRWHFNGHQTESLNISVNDRESEGNLIIDYSYLTDLFLAKEIEFINQHIINLLWHALDNPEKSISRLNMLSEKEVHKILNQFGNENGKKKYILDKNLNLVPIGIPGELYIAGEEVSKEFIQNPFNPEEKLYKTGRLARWYPEGEILDLGLTVKPKETQVIVSATFTSEPVGDYIEWWGGNFGYNFKIGFTPYNQVFQELLDKNSMLAKNQDGINVILLRFEDYIRSVNGTEEIKLLKLEQIFEDIKESIANFENPAYLIFALFPVSTQINLSTAIQNKINELNVRLEETVTKHRNIYTVNLGETKELYCIEEMFDIIKDKEGHMPFTDEFYAAIGTEIARKICAIKKQQFKVIVLDCDNTLWKGICGEQGALGVKIDGPYRKLQEFMLQRYNEGMLLAVCTKNNEKDVFEVFETNPDMVLSRMHIVNWKINWDEKSGNIRNIAEELNLGLDSFIFIDDNPLECSKMVESCPEVLTLQLPPVEEHIPVFLGHVWAFDRVKVTKEDTLRSEMYKAENQRKAAKVAGLAIDDFIKSLGLKVSMRLIDESEIERAAQMTQRTNQFNLSIKRRTEKEISDLMKDSKTNVFVIEASDRFGDYGIVGLVILRDNNDKLSVDTFLLSCRILGRKVEDVILAGIGRFAHEQGKSKIEAVYVPSEKNKPILEFIERVKWDVLERDDTHTVYSVRDGKSTDGIESIDFYFNKRYENRAGEAENNVHENFKIKQFITLNKKAIQNEFDLSDTKILEGTIHKQHLLPLENFTGRRLLELPINKKQRSGKSEYKAPTNEIEDKIVDTLKNILKIRSVGIDDNFFEIGGDSLTAIQLISELYKQNLELKIQDIYKYCTVREMSKHICFYNKKLNVGLLNKSDNALHNYLKNSSLQSEPLHESILSGKLPPLDAVALSYIPDDLMLVSDKGSFSLSLDRFVNKPILYNYMNTGFGNIGVIVLPVFSKDIYNDKKYLVNLSTQAIISAEKLGAKVVSLTGLIPSATNYGADIIESCRNNNSNMQITTGHATTSASVILSLTRLLYESGRMLNQEEVCVLGLGSIGSIVLKLLLSVLPHPYSITLCDIYEKRKHLEELKHTIETEYGFNNHVKIVYSKGLNLPNEVYQATLIIGATNVPDILDVSKLTPGTLIIDDSAPHCFSKREAISRLKIHCDILFSEGGTLDSPNPIDKKIYLPSYIDSRIMEKYHEHFYRGNNITGCILSSLLTVKYKELKPVYGNVSTMDCIKQYWKLNKLGFKGASLHCDEYVLPKDYVERFKRVFGNNVPELSAFTGTGGD